MTRYGEYRLVMWTGWAIFLLGYGLMIQLDDTANMYVLASIILSVISSHWLTIQLLECRAEKVLYPLVASVGIGCLFQVSDLFND